MSFFAGYHTGFGMVCIGMVFAIIAVASVAWAREESSGGSVDYERFYGLFQICTEVEGETEDCDEHTDPHDKLQATRALATSGMICIIIALCLVCLHMFLFYKDRSTMPSTWTLKSAIGFACFAAVINTIANVIYGEFFDNENPDAHIYYAYVFLILASILASVGSIVAYLGRPMRIEAATIITTRTGDGATVAVITTSSHHTSSIVNPAYPPQPPEYGYPAYPKPAYPSQPYPSPPAYSDPAYPPPQPYSYEPPKY